MKKNLNDFVTYCTAAERAAASAEILADASFDTGKYYEVDTKLAFIVYNGAWYAV